MIFRKKITNDIIRDALDKHVPDGMKAILLVDNEFSSLDDNQKLLAVINVEDNDPEIIDSYDTDVYIIYACTQDDLGIPFIKKLHAVGKKYYPVWEARPLGYISSNNLARQSLEQEYIYQKANGFDKWDFGYRDFVNLIQCLDITKEVSGCYLEVGCYRGSSAGVVLRYLVNSKRSMTTVFLDVFEGFCYETAINSSDAVWKYTHETEGLEVVSSRLLGYLGESDKVKISVEKNNIINDDLPPVVINHGIAVANIDVDLHEAVYAALIKVSPHVSQHGIIVVEDPGHTPLLIGAKLALEQFLATDYGAGYIPIAMESGQTLLLKK